MSQDVHTVSSDRGSPAGSGLQANKERSQNIAKSEHVAHSLDELQLAYENARTKAGNGVWPRLSAHEQTTAVYEELRALDAARHGQRNQPSEHSIVSNDISGQRKIRLRLSGQMAAWTVSNVSVLPSGRKTRALLAAIALSPRPLMRGRLAELLWSRRPEEQARASLRQELQLLLKALAPAKAEILQVTRDHLSLVPGSTWVDANEIMRATNSKPAALSLVDGELLDDLDGIDSVFDMWLATERERLRDRSRSMAETLLREQPDPASIVPAAQRLLQVDRTHEEAWRALMRAYVEQGERGMAIQAYDRCRGVLAEMLDAAPSAETQTLLSEIRGPSSKYLPTRPPRAAPSVDKQAAIADTPPGKAPQSRAAKSSGDTARVGVLPLRCVGLPEDASYLGPSLANEITVALSRFRWLSVISQNSLAPSVRDMRDGTVAFRRSAGLDFLLDGAIQRSRNKLRVTLRLLDLKEDNQVVWARRFDRTADDPLSVQEEISNEVAAQIEPVILLAEARRGCARRDLGRTAQDLILRSVPLITRLERDDFMRAGAHLARAIELEPGSSRAHGWYATWHALLISQYWAANPKQAAIRAGELAERAIILDPYSAVAFSVAGHVQAFPNHSPLEGAALHEHGMELNPNFAAGWALSGITQMILGDTNKAECHYQRYKSLSPLAPYSFIFDGLYAAVHLPKRDYHAAVAMGRAVTQLNPSYSAGYKPYLAALGHLGEKAEAETVRERLQTIEPNVTVDSCLSAFPFHRHTDRDHFADGLRRALVPDFAS